MFTVLRIIFTLLQLNDNEVADWNCVEKLTANKNLVTVYLERNPLAKDAAYRRKVMLTLPWLQQLDATMCRFVVNQNYTICLDIPVLIN